MSPALHAQLPSPLDILLRDGSVTNLTDEIEEVDSRPFAYGGSSYVYKYKARPSSSINLETGSSLFAVKAIRLVDVRKEKKLEREIRNWASLDHPHVLKLHGYVERNDARVSLVSDFMSHGTAVAYLKDVGRGNIIDVSREMASGLAFLHAKNIAHGDIKGDNVLITNSGQACIGDFGLSRILRFDGTASFSTTDGNRACRWTAAEYLDWSSGCIAPSSEGDVWSFGCTILQLISGQLPYYDLPHNQLSEGQVVLRIQSGELPKFPLVFHRDDFEKYREGISAFCKLCWIKDRASRPSITTLMHILNSFCPDMHCNLFRDKGTDDLITPISNGASTSSGSVLNDQPETSNVSDNNGSDTSSESRSRSSSQSTIGPEPNLQQNASDDSTQPESHDQEDVPETQTEAGGDNDLRYLLSTIPSPPSPTLESMLEYKRKTAQMALNELCQKNSDLSIEYVSGVSPGSGIHLVTCMVNGVEFGTGRIEGKKKVAKDLAALAALKRLYVEKPDYFKSPVYRYEPVLNSHLHTHHLNTRSSWIPSSGNTPEGWIFRCTFKFDGITVAEGQGSIPAVAEEEAAREVANVWRSAATNGA